MGGNDGKSGEIPICSNENSVLLNRQVQPCLFSCHSQAVSVCEMCPLFRSAEGNWPSQLHHRRRLSLPASPCPLRGIWSTVQLLESLFKGTNVFLLLNINSCYKCDRNNEAVHLREQGDWFYWWTDSSILMTYARYMSSYVCVTAFGNKRAICKRRISLRINCFCSVSPTV